MMLSQKMRPHKQVEVMLLVKTTHPLIVAEDINKLECIIMLCYFFGLELFLLSLLCNIVLDNYHVDFNVVLHVMHFHSCFR